MRSLLIEKGVLTPQEIAASVDLMDSRSPALGAKVVARAWADPAFKKLLLKDTRAALMQMGIDIGRGAGVRAPSRTRPRCTTSSSARCAPATPRCCSAFRRPGTRASPTARAPSPIRAACWPSSASRCRDGRRGARARFHRRPALHRAADAAQGHQGLERGAARRHRHPRLHDRHRASRGARAGASRRSARPDPVKSRAKSRAFPPTRPATRRRPAVPCAPRGRVVGPSAGRTGAADTPKLVELAQQLAPPARRSAPTSIPSAGARTR